MGGGKGKTVVVHLPPGTKKIQRQDFFESVKEAWHIGTLDFEPSGFLTVRRQNFKLLSM